MKIVIDLDEKYYNDIKNSPTASNYSTLYALFGIRNGTPLEEELEKIKTEIGKNFVDLQDGSEEWRSYVNDSVLECYEIVEKRISELKGENNGNS